MDDPVNTRPPRSIGSPVERAGPLAWIAAGMAPLLSVLVIRPWTPGAFPVWDFDDLLPIFHDSHGFWNTLVSFARADRHNGLARYFQYSQLTLTWLIAGDNPVAWRWIHALFMLTAAVLIVVAARRVGAAPLAAGIAALLFTIGVPSTEGWLFLMGEPFGLILLLLFFLAGAGYTTTPAWKSRAVLLAVLAFVVIDSKEVLGVCLPALVLFAVCWVPGQGFRRPALGPRERWLGGLLLGALIVQVWLMRSALHDAPPGAYGTRFGRSGLEPGRFSTLFQTMLLPVHYTTSAASTALYPANLAFLSLLFLGLALYLRTAGQRRGGGWWALGFLSYPAVGALTYSFWPRFSAFYGIPFFAGSIGMLILAATGVEHAHRAGRWIVSVLGAVAIGYSAIPSVRTVGHQRAVANLAAQIVTSIPRAPRLDTLYVVVPKQGGRSWPITARELRAYGVALRIADSVLPVVLNASCEDVAARLQRPLGRDAVINDRNPCGRLPARTRTWVAALSYRDWLTLQPRSDTLLVDLLAPSWPARP